MTMEAASMQSQAMSVARAEVAAELAQVRAERDWLAEQFVGARQCPETRLGRCPWTHTFGAGFCPVSMKSGTRRECWLRAAAKATGGEA
jgi:hypothetical protein